MLFSECCTKLIAYLTCGLFTANGRPGRRHRGMEERRKGKIMYNSDPQPPQAVQAQPNQQHTQNLTIQQPRVIYGKPMPVSVQQDIQQQNTRVIYVQPSPMVQMQVPGDPNLRTAYVLSNPVNIFSKILQRKKILLMLIFIKIQSR